MIDDVTPAEPLEFLLVVVVSLLPGIVLAVLLSGVYPPFGMAGGLFGGSVLGFFAFALFHGR